MTKLEKKTYHINVVQLMYLFLYHVTVPLDRGDPSPILRSLPKLQCLLLIWAIVL